MQLIEHDIAQVECDRPLFSGQDIKTNLVLSVIFEATFSNSSLSDI